MPTQTALKYGTANKNACNSVCDNCKSRQQLAKFFSAEFKPRPFFRLGLEFETTWASSTRSRHGASVLGSYSRTTDDGDGDGSSSPPPISYAHHVCGVYEGTQAEKIGVEVDGKTINLRCRLL